MDGSAGYVVCYEFARENLRLGLDVVEDAVNPVSETRQAWRVVGEWLEVSLAEIELVCSDKRVHQQRIAVRTADMPGFVLLTWEEVESRQYDPCDRGDLVLDTAHRTVAPRVRTGQRLGSPHRFFRQARFLRRYLAGDGASGRGAFHILQEGG